MRALWRDILRELGEKLQRVEDLEAYCQRRPPANTPRLTVALGVPRCKVVAGKFLRIQIEPLP